jgi:hypothetical protein
MLQLQKQIFIQFNNKRKKKIEIEEKKEKFLRENVSFLDFEILQGQYNKNFHDNLCHGLVS